MPYFTTSERLALARAYKRGYLAGLREGAWLSLEARFGVACKKLLPKLKAIQTAKQLRALILVIAKADRLDEIKQLLSRVAVSPPAYRSS